MRETPDKISPAFGCSSVGSPHIQRSPASPDVSAGGSGHISSSIETLLEFHEGKWLRRAEVCYQLQLPACSRVVIQACGRHGDPISQQQIFQNMSKKNKKMMSGSFKKFHVWCVPVTLIEKWWFQCVRSPSLPEVTSRRSRGRQRFGAQIQRLCGTALNFLTRHDVEQTTRGLLRQEI